MKIFKFIRNFLIIGCFVFVFANIFCYTYALITPKIQVKNVNSFYLYDNKEQLVFQGSGSQEWINLENISSHLINATIAVEDKNFYNHKGFDFLRIGKALLENIKSKDIVQGASTITQQYAKNLFLTFEKSWSRKWKEMWLTFEIETHYSKDEILEGYLNTINYGHGMYGVENAAQYYFNKSASQLDIAESSILAGIPNSPNNYSPINNYELSKKRQQIVLSRMKANNYINDLEYNSANKQELVFYGKVDNLNLKTLMYYQDAVMTELETIDKIPASYLETGGLKIYTSLDLKAQTVLENSISNNLKNTSIQVSTVMMDPNNGKVLALTGGRDYSKSQYNRAINSKRQPGSAIKPFLYYAALENGFTASSTFLSQPTTFTLANEQSYSPQNSGELYGNKPISLATAIAYSDNIYAIKTHLFLGQNTIGDITKRVGINNDIEAIPSAPLGSNEINILELTKGYATFANLGSKVTPHLINRIEDMNGNVLYENKKEKEAVLNKSLSFILNDLLSTTYDRNLIDYGYPTCINISVKLSRKYAMKSGTTDTDSWIVGYNKDIVVTSWVGYDDNKMISGQDGAKNKNILADILESYLKDNDKKWYEMPENVVGVLVNPIDGTIANKDSKNKRVMYYIKGTEPSDTISVFDLEINQ